MKRVYIILGNGVCGKPGLITSLTGAAKEGTRYIRLKDGKGLFVRVQLRSAQALGKTPSDVARDISLDAGQSHLISLRTWAYNGFPDGSDYIKRLEDHAEIAALVVMDTDIVTVPYLLPLVPVEFISRTLVFEPEALAKRVRKTWNWE